MTLAEKVGELLTEARGETSRRELARRIGVVHTTLHNVEHGRENLTLARLERIAAGYGVTIDVRAVATEVAEARAASDALDAEILAERRDDALRGSAIKRRRPERST